MFKRYVIPVLLISLALLLAGCAATTSEETNSEPVEVTLMLDWVPNTNHTGLYVAAANDYFAEAGLNVEIIQPGEVYPEAAVASGAADFGISFQEYVTLSRADDVPIVSIAAIIQHNTSGFASRSAAGITDPAAFEGLRYGSFGTPFEEPTLDVLMACAGGDFSQLEVVNTGFADPLALLDQDQIDLAWIFYGWQGFQAAQQGIELNTIMLNEWTDCIPDYYTPVIITSEATIENNPDTVRAFLRAVSRGYEFAIENPAAAAAILVEAVPELDAELVNASQTWLADQYQADAARWGDQQYSVWQGYTDWMVENEILAESIDVDAAFTAEFLPE